MNEFKEQLIETGMNEQQAALLAAKFAAHEEERASSRPMSGEGYFIDRWCAGLAGKRRGMMMAFASLALVTLASLKYLIFHW